MQAMAEAGRNINEAVSEGSIITQEGDEAKCAIGQKFAQPTSVKLGSPSAVPKGKAAKAKKIKSSGKDLSKIAKRDAKA